MEGRFGGRPTVVSRACHASLEVTGYCPWLSHTGRQCLTDRKKQHRLHSPDRNGTTDYCRSDPKSAQVCFIYPATATAGTTADSKHHRRVGCRKSSRLSKGVSSSLGYRASNLALAEIFCSAACVYVTSVAQTTYSPTPAPSSRRSESF